MRKNTLIFYFKNKWHIHIVVFISSFFLFLSAIAKPTVASSLGAYYREITIDNSSNSNSLTNYQVLLSLDTTSLINAGKMRSDCGDIRFADSDNSTEITNYWVENCNSNTTTLWVKVPSIAASSTKTIYVYYGDSSLTSLSSVTNTFIRDINNALALWHMDESSGTSVADETGDGYTGTATAPVNIVSGKFGNARSFSGSSGYISIANESTFPFGKSARTVCAWAQTSTITTGGGGSTLGIIFDSGTSLTDEYFGLGRKSADLKGFGWNDDFVASTGFWTIGKWNYVCLAYDGVTASMYANGSQVYSQAVSWSTVDNGGTYIGNDVNNFIWNGLIDEVSYYSKTLSAAEVTDLYNNYGYATTHYSGHILVRQYTSPVPSASVGSETTTSTSASSTSVSSTSTTQSLDTISDVLPGWDHGIQVGPHASGSTFIGRGQAQTFINKSALHDDAYVTVDNSTVSSLSNATIPFPWQDGLNLAGNIYLFQVKASFNNYQIPSFDQPVTIILPFKPDLLPQNKIPTIALYDTTTNQWDILPNNVINWKNQTIAATTKHFSYFAVVYEEKNTPPHEINIPSGRVLGSSQSKIISAQKKINLKPKIKKCFLFFCWSVNFFAFLPSRFL